MKASTPARLNRSTPPWPEIRIAVTKAKTTVTINGVLTPVADQQAALGAVAAQATALGRPVRARITDTGGISRVIVEADGTTTVLSTTNTLPVQTPAGTPPPAGTAPRAAVAPATPLPPAPEPQESQPVDAGDPGDLDDSINQAVVDDTDDSIDQTGVDDQDDEEPSPAPAAASSQSKRRRGRRKSKAKKKAGPTPAKKRGKGWRGVPAPVRWGAPPLAALAVASLGVLIFHGKSQHTDDTAAPAVAAVPPAGQLYTETGPPGWTQQAAWTVQLAKDAPAPITTADGTTIAVTAADGSANPQTGDTRYLSVLETDGRTRWANPLPTAPRVGPILARVDGVDVALVAGTRDVTYWPLTGGDPTVVSLPSGATLTPTGVIKLRDDQLGYLHAGAIAVVDQLPRTEPAIAVDGAVIVTQADDGAWWNLRSDAAPTVAKPAPPTGVTGLRDFLAVGPDHVITAWTTADQRTCAVTAYATNDAATQATTTLPCASLPRAGATYASTGAVAGVGTLMLRGGTITAAPGVTITAVVDQVYGTKSGDSVLVSADGNTTALPAGTLIPTGLSDGHLLVVDSDHRLYALTAAAR